MMMALTVNLKKNISTEFRQMEKLSNVTGCCSRKPLEWHIVLSVIYFFFMKHILPVDLITESISIGCMNMKTASHTGMLVYLLLLSRLKMLEWIISSWCRLVKKMCTGEQC